MLFVIGFVLLTNVFAQNPVCSVWNEDTWEQSLFSLSYCTEEVPFNIINGITYRCCNKCEQCYKFEGAKCVIDKLQWPTINTNKPNWAWDDGSNKEFILFIVMPLMLM